MQWTVERVTSPSAGTPSDKAAHYLPIRQGERWRAVTGPVPVANPEESTFKWLTPASGDLVRIPLIPYQVPRDSTLAMAFALQMGLTVGRLLPSARKVQIVLGHRLDDLADQGLARARFWIGLAVEG